MSDYLSTKIIKAVERLVNQSQSLYIEPDKTILIIIPAERLAEFTETEQYQALTSIKETAQHCFPDREVIVTTSDIAIGTITEFDEFKIKVTTNSE